MRIILASKSPRRRELLGNIFDKFEIIVKECDETLPQGTPTVKGVELLAIKKGEPVANMHPDALVISSDTLVELDGVALGKPRDTDDAYRMLKSLSAKTHNVHTGVAVHYNGKCLSGVATTAVKFRALSDDEIYKYIESGEPMDKAGAYGIQGGAGAFVERITGDFDTVVGLSVKLTKKLADEVVK